MSTVPDACYPLFYWTLTTALRRKCCEGHVTGMAIKGLGTSGAHQTSQQTVELELPFKKPGPKSPAGGHGLYFSTKGT